MRFAESIAVVVPLTAFGLLGCTSGVQGIARGYGDQVLEDNSEVRTASLPDFEAVQAPQDQVLWCWAASAAMVHAYRMRALGLDQAGVAGDEEWTQEAIAARIHQHDGDSTLKVAAASRFEMYRALCPNLETHGFDAIWQAIREDFEEAATEIVNETAEGRETSSVDVDSDPRVAVNSVLDKYLPHQSAPLEALLSGEPAIVALNPEGGGSLGHICVVVGAQWRQLKTGSGTTTNEFVSQVLLGSEPRHASGPEPSREEKLALEASARLGVRLEQLVWVDVINPIHEDKKATLENEMLERLTADEFRERVNFVATVEDAHAVLTRWNGLVEIETEYESEQ